MKTAQSQYGQIGDASWPFTIIATVAPRAATSTSPIRPSARSTNTTVVASVFDCAGLAVSRIRTTSPPIVLGRKLLKNPATRYDDNSVRAGTTMPCARSSSCQRHALVSTLKK